MCNPDTPKTSWGIAPVPPCPPLYGGDPPPARPQPPSKTPSGGWAPHQVSARSEAGSVERPCGFTWPCHITFVLSSSVESFWFQDVATSLRPPTTGISPGIFCCQVRVGYRDRPCSSCAACCVLCFARVAVFGAVEGVSGFRTASPSRPVSVPCLPSYLANGVQRRRRRWARPQSRRSSDSVGLAVELRRDASRRPVRPSRS